MVKSEPRKGYSTRVFFVGNRMGVSIRPSGNILEQRVEAIDIWWRSPRRFSHAVIYCRDGEGQREVERLYFNRNPDDDSDLVLPLVVRTGASGTRGVTADGTLYRLDAHEKAVADMIVRNVKKH